MCHRSLGFVTIAVLALAASACGGSTTTPAPAAPTAAVTATDALPPVWDADARSGGLPGGLDGGVLFAIETANEPLRIEGVVRAIRGTCPNIGLRVGDHVIRTFERTAFEGQRCAAIAVRDRVVVVARPLGDDLMGAIRVVSRKP
jgi:hypothetical protein